MFWSLFCFVSFKLCASRLAAVTHCVSFKRAQVSLFILSLKLNLSIFKYWMLKERNYLKVAPILYFFFSQTILAAFYRMGRELLLSLHCDCVLHCGEQGRGNNGCKHDCRIEWLPVIVAAISDVGSRKKSRIICAVDS